jgi:hypothetical protein
MLRSWPSQKQSLSDIGDMVDRRLHGLLEADAGFRDVGGVRADIEAVHVATAIIRIRVPLPARAVDSD